MTRHRLPLRTESDRKTAHAWIDRALRLGGWTMVMQPPARSNIQSKRMWAFLDDIAAQKEWEGKKRTSEAWKDLFSAALKTQEIVRGLEGGIVALGARTSEMSPAEMIELNDLIEAWGAQNGVVFTDTLSGGERAPGPDGALAGAGLGARDLKEAKK